MIHAQTVQNTKGPKRAECDDPRRYLANLKTYSDVCGKKVWHKIWDAQQENKKRKSWIPLV